MPGPFHHDFYLRPSSNQSLLLELDTFVINGIQSFQRLLCCFMVNREKILFDHRIRPGLITSFLTHIEPFHVSFPVPRIQSQRPDGDLCTMANSFGGQCVVSSAS